MPDPIPSMNAGRGRRPVVEPPLTPARARRPRFVLIALPMFAVFAAFGAVIWLAYEDGSYGAPLGEPPVIKADASPIKLAPDDPGGRQIPDPGQVRELLTEPSTTETVERLLPPEEEPLTPTARPLEEDPESDSDRVVAAVPVEPDAVGGPEITQLEPAETTSSGRRQGAADAEDGGEDRVETARVEEPPTEAAAALDALLDEVSNRADASPAPTAESRVAAIDPGRDEETSTPTAGERAPDPPATTDVRPAIAVEPPAPPTSTTSRPPSTAPAVADIAPGEPVTSGSRPQTAARPQTATPGEVARTRPAGGSEPPTVIVPRVEPAPSSSNVAALDGRYRIQLAAVRAEADARRAWDLFLVDLGSTLQGLQPFIERADTSNGVFYRVQVGPFAALEDAEDLCEELKQRNASCFVVRR